jgi:hypothetical protein
LTDSEPKTLSELIKALKDWRKENNGENPFIMLEGCDCVGRWNGGLRFTGVKDFEGRVWLQLERN